MDSRGISSFVITLLPLLAFLVFGYSMNWISDWLAITILVCAGAGLALGVLPILRSERKFQDKLVHIVEENNEKLVHLEEKALETDLILNSIPDPLFLLSAKKKILTANQAAGRFILKPLTGLALDRAFTNLQLEQGVEEALTSGTTITLDYKVDLPVERNYQVRIVPVRLGRSARVIPDSPAVLMAFQEVTAVLRTKKVQSDFVANVSHELRTPLTSLIGFTETLRTVGKDDDEAREKFLDIMQEQADRMYRLVADLLSLSKIEMDEHTVPEDPVNIDDVITKVCDMLSLKAGERDMRFAIDLPQNLPMVKGDEDQLTQVFQNLVDNALKYGMAGTPVEVEGRKDHGELTITVIDHGIGIPQAKLSRLTERFYRVDKARSRDMGGTGLGLAIVKHIINRHRGRLSITSEEGKGSRFSVTLPLE